MKDIKIFALNIYDIDDSKIKILHKMQQERIEKIQNEKGRKQALASELLLLYVVKEFKPENVPFPPLKEKGEFGKPYFSQNTNFKFNISHSGEWAIIAVADSEIGIDIEKIGKIRTAVARRILHEKEKEKFFLLNEEMQRKTFYDYWVLKESIVKASGRGMNDAFCDMNIEISDQINLKTYEDKMNLYLLPFDKNLYKIGICIFSKEKYKIFMKILSSHDIIV